VASGGLLIAGSSGSAIWRAFSVLGVVASLAGGSACQGAPSAPRATGESLVQKLVPRVVAVWPHDPSVFTQGLLWSDGRLFESHGIRGRSGVRRVVLETGEADRFFTNPPGDFGEGLARAGGELVQLTWEEGVAHRLGVDSLQPLGTYRYRGEGWGLAFDGTVYWMSDGSSSLQRRDASTFEVVASLAVTLDGAPVPRLNELEFVDGQIFANQWMTDRILRIDPRSGAVTAVIDASGLLSGEERSRTDVLNGIAYDPSRRVFFLTGKLWPKLFEVEFVPDLRP
jgi:glutamine cyclotransferase